MTDETKDENKPTASPPFFNVDPYLYAIKDLMQKFSNLPVFKPATEDSAPWGYDLYPERKEVHKVKLGNVIRMKEGREFYDKNRCEEKIFGCVKNSSLVKLMMGALNSAGWSVFCYH